MIDMKIIADKADMIISGYAFSKIPYGNKAVNLQSSSACVIGSDDTVIESSMDDIELEIVVDYFRRNKRFLEE